MLKLDKVHAILMCPTLNYDRDSLGVCLFMNHPSASYSRQLKDYFGGDNAWDATVHKGASVIASFVDKWLLRASSLLVILSSGFLEILQVCGRKIHD